MDLLSCDPAQSIPGRHPVLKPMNAKSSAKNPKKMEPVLVLFRPCNINSSSSKSHAVRNLVAGLTQTWDMAELAASVFADLSYLQRVSKAEGMRLSWGCWLNLFGRVWRGSQKRIPNFRTLGIWLWNCALCR